MNTIVDGVRSWFEKQFALDRMTEVSFLIPVNEDKRAGNGKPHDSSKWHDFNYRLVTGFKGYTKSPSMFGTYVNNAGEVIDDESVEYRLAIKKSDIPKVRKFLVDASRLFGQECIYFKNGDKAELLYR